MHERYAGSLATRSAHGSRTATCASTSSPATRCEGNRLGDPAQRPLAIYLPPQYDALGSRRYPVLYVLHGYTGRRRGAARIAALGNQRRSVGRPADRAGPHAARNRWPLVDGFTRLGGSQYVDSIHNGDYATYTVRDVIGHVDRGYRTIAAEGGRAVLGKSSGGFGAMHLVMEHPGRVCGVRFAQRRLVLSVRAPSRVPDASSERSRAHEWRRRRFRRGLRSNSPNARMAEYTTMEMLGYAAAYSPRSATRVRSRLTLRNGNRRASNEAVFARWLAFRSGRTRDGAGCRTCAACGLRYLDCGRRDEYGLDIGARVVPQRMRDLRPGGSSRGIRRRSPQRGLSLRNLASGARRRFGCRMNRIVLARRSRSARADAKRRRAYARRFRQLPTPSPDPARYSDPAMNYTAPADAYSLGRRVVPLAAAWERSGAVAVWVVHPGQRRYADDQDRDGIVQRRARSVGRRNSKAKCTVAAARACSFARRRRWRCSTACRRASSR